MVNLTTTIVSCLYFCNTGYFRRTSKTVYVDTFHTGKLTEENWLLRPIRFVYGNAFNFLTGWGDDIATIKLNQLSIDAKLNKLREIFESQYQINVDVNNQLFAINDQLSSRPSELLYVTEESMNNLKNMIDFKGIIKNTAGLISEVEGVSNPNPINIFDVDDFYSTCNYVTTKYGGAIYLENSVCFYSGKLMCSKVAQQDNYRNNCYFYGTQYLITISGVVNKISEIKYYNEYFEFKPWSMRKLLNPSSGSCLLYPPDQRNLIKQECGYLRLPTKVFKQIDSFSSVVMTKDITKATRKVVSKLPMLSCSISGTYTEVKDTIDNSNSACQVQRVIDNPLIGIKQYEDYSIDLDDLFKKNMIYNQRYLDLYSEVKSFTAFGAVMTIHMVYKDEGKFNGNRCNLIDKEAVVTSNVCTDVFTYSLEKNYKVLISSNYDPLAMIDEGMEGLSKLPLRSTGHSVIDNLEIDDKAFPIVKLRVKNCIDDGIDFDCVNNQMVLKPINSEKRNMSTQGLIFPSDRSSYLNPTFIKVNQTLTDNLASMRSLLKDYDKISLLSMNAATKEEKTDLWWTGVVTSGTFGLLLIPLYLDFMARIRDVIVHRDFRILQRI